METRSIPISMWGRAAWGWMWQEQGQWLRRAPLQKGLETLSSQLRSWAVGSLPGFESVFVFLLGISHVGRQLLVQVDALPFPSSDPWELGEDVWRPGQSLFICRWS